MISVYIDISNETFLVKTIATLTYEIEIIAFEIITKTNNLRV